MTKKATAAYDRLLKAAGEYVNVLGGVAIVGGGVEIWSWPGEGENRFRVAVNITGRKPPAPGGPVETPKRAFR